MQIGRVGMLSELYYSLFRLIFFPWKM